MTQYKSIFIYLAKFLGFFCLLFYGTEAVIGLSSHGNHYSSFVAQYLNFIVPFRTFLLSSSKLFLSIFGYQTYLSGDQTLKMVNGRGVQMVYSCLGYGVLSFWIAFIFANNGSWKKKAAWMAGGVFALCTLNIIRISLLLVAINRDWPIPFGWDHHTWFNIVAYFFIFLLIYFYDRSSGERPTVREPKAAKRLTESVS